MGKNEMWNSGNQGIGRLARRGIRGAVRGTVDGGIEAGGRGSSGATGEE